MEVAQSEFTPYVTRFRLSVTRLPDGSGEGVMTRMHVWRGTEGTEYGAVEAPRPYFGVRQGQPNEAMRQRSEQRAARRATKQVRLACKAYGLDHLLTLTKRGRFKDPDEALDAYKRFWRSVEARCKARDAELPARVGVPEMHKAGGWHIHVAVKGFQDIRWLRRCWYRALGGTGDESGDATPGQVDIRGPRTSSARTWSRDKLAAYLSKYISKTFDAAASGRKRFWATKGYTALLNKSVLWLEARDEGEAIVQTYHIVAGGNVFGVTHWCTHDGAVYGIHTERPPTPPF